MTFTVSGVKCQWSEGCCGGKVQHDKGEENGYLWVEINWSLSVHFISVHIS